MPTQVVHSRELLDTPIFLRFLNMIINDATVQLDEGLEVGSFICSQLTSVATPTFQNLSKIKRIEDVKESEEWEALNNEEKKQVVFHKALNALFLYNNR